MQKSDGSFMETWNETVQMLMNGLLPDDVVEKDEDLHKEIREKFKQPPQEIINSDATMEIQLTNEEVEV